MEPLILTITAFLVFAWVILAAVTIRGLIKENEELTKEVLELTNQNTELKYRNMSRTAKNR